MWPWFVGLLPFAGVVYALDGVLIGAGDVRLPAQHHAGRGTARLPAGDLAGATRSTSGLGGVWAGLALFILVRFGTMVWRWRSARWAVLGATR